MSNFNSTKFSIYTQENWQVVAKELRLIPDESIAMSILGFEDVQKATEIVRIDEHLEIEVASLDRIFLLKLFAWQDRNQLHNRDADDMAFIINNYLAINQERASNEYYEQIFLAEEFNLRSTWG